MVGQSTCVMRSGHPTKLDVPADTYLFMNRTYSNNQFSVRDGRTTTVDPKETAAIDLRPATAEPAVSMSAPTDEPNDAWGRYVEHFIATYELDAPQQSQALSILKELRGRAREYRSSHKAEYEAASSSVDKKKRQQQIQTLDAPVDEMFQELKDRLAVIPTETQKKAIATGKRPAAKGASSLPAGR